MQKGLQPDSKFLSGTNKNVFFRTLPLIVSYLVMVIIVIEKYQGLQSKFSMALILRVKVPSRPDLDLDLHGINQLKLVEFHKQVLFVEIAIEHHY